MAAIAVVVGAANATMMVVMLITHHFLLKQEVARAAANAWAKGFNEGIDCAILSEREVDP